MDCQTHSTQLHCSICLCKISHSYHRKKKNQYRLFILENKWAEKAARIILEASLSLVWCHCAMKEPRCPCLFSALWHMVSASQLLAVVDLTTSSIIIWPSLQIYLEKKKKQCVSYIPREVAQATKTDPAETCHSICTFSQTDAWICGQQPTVLTHPLNSAP